MNKLVKGAGGVLGVLVVGLGGAFLWGKATAAARLDTVYETHRVDFATPWPLTEAELDAIRAERLADVAAQSGGATQLVAVSGNVPVGASAAGAAPPAAPPADLLAGVDLASLATANAVARGKHLIESRYACVQCHGKDLGGGTMIDEPAIGALLGPNLTTGKGSRTLNYTAADWDRAIRHGVKPDGRPTVMPSADYHGMSDQELSDLVTYIRVQPPVDEEVAPPTFGPVGTMLVATGRFELTAAQHPDHLRAHEVLPPGSDDTATFGAHLAQVCAGCHRADYSGGPITSGDPSWPAASNITMHEQGMKGWTLEQFTVALREAKRPDGTTLQAPMSNVAPFAAKMTDTELQALFAYLQSLPPMPTGR